MKNSRRLLLEKTERFANIACLPGALWPAVRLVSISAKDSRETRVNRPVYGARLRTTHNLKHLVL